MKPGDLTTLKHVKEWLRVTDGVTDDLYSRMIQATSAYIQSWLNRKLALQTYHEFRDGIGMGAGRNVMSFGEAPAYSVALLKINGVVIPASPDGGIQQPGYGFDTDQIWLADTSLAGTRFGTISASFPRGRRNVELIYDAGYVTVDEAQTIPADPYAVQTNFLWVKNVKVTWPDGTLLTKVSLGPLTGQYMVDSEGTYTFSVADTGKDVLITYGYIPPEIEQACIQLIGLRVKEMDRIGITSKAVGGETISYTQKDMPTDVQTLLNQYRKVVIVL